MKTIKYNAPTKYMREHELQIVISDAKWKKINLDVTKVSLSTKLRYFHYRLLNRHITTNVKRSKYKDISSMCTFCNTVYETVNNLFYTCIKVSRLRTSLERWIKYFFGIELKITEPMTFLLNYTGAEQPLIKTMLMVFNQYVSATKCYKKELSGFPQLLENLEKW